jgi:hypothetical protein
MSHKTEKEKGNEKNDPYVVDRRCGNLWNAFFTNSSKRSRLNFGHG